MSRRLSSVRDCHPEAGGSTRKPRQGSSGRPCPRRGRGLLVAIHQRGNWLRRPRLSRALSGIRGTGRYPSVATEGGDVQRMVTGKHSDGTGTRAKLRCRQSAMHTTGNDPRQSGPHPSRAPQSWSETILGAIGVWPGRPWRARGAVEASPTRVNEFAARFGWGSVRPVPGFRIVLHRGVKTHLKRLPAVYLPL